MMQPGDKAEGLELTLTLFQLPQDQGPKDLHILMEKGRKMEGSGTFPQAQSVLSSGPGADTCLHAALQ